MEDTLTLNSSVYEHYKDFRKILNEVRLKNPLVEGYYPYYTIEVIPFVLETLENHHLSLEDFIKDKVVLDLGCGDGDLSFFFEFIGAKKVIAMDYAATNFNGLKGFKTLHGKLHSNVLLIEGDIHSFNFTNLPTIDTAFVFGFLYHSKHPLWILENLSKRVQYLFLTTKVFDDEKPYAYFYDIAEANNDPTNWWCFTPKAFNLMLKRMNAIPILSCRQDHYVGRSHPVDPNLDGRLFILASCNSQNMRVDGITLIFEKGFYQDEGGRRWMAREGTMIIHLDEKYKVANLCMEVTCGELSWYHRVPFELSVMSGKQVIQRAEFNAGRQKNQIRIPLAHQASSPLVIHLISSESFVPSDLGISKDKRQLSLQVGNISLGD